MALYDAFVSYSHAKDKPIAAALQSVVQKLGKPWYRRRALRVFRDDTSLSATPELWPSIERALGESRFLILLASPEAAASPWVNKEVAWWLDHKSAGTLLIAVTDGELVWDNSVGDFTWRDGMPLPPVLTGRFAAEPKWVDLRAYRDKADTRDAKFTELAADFAAAVHGTPKEDLLSQEVRQQRRALTLAWSAAGSLLILTGLAGWQWWETDAAKKTAERNFGIAKQAADQVVFKLAQGLRDVQGMRVESVRKILDTGRDMMDQLARTAPEDLSLQRSRGAMLDEFVVTYLAAGDLARAGTTVEEGLTIWRKLVNVNPANTQWQRDLSVSLRLLGNVRLAANDRPGAHAAYEESLAIRRKLAATDPGNTDWQRDLSVILNNIGDVRRASGDRRAALAAYQEALAIMRKLVAAEPANAVAQRELGVCLEKIGDVRRDAGDQAGALAAYEESLPIMRRLAVADPQHARWQHDLSVTLITVGNARESARDLAGALAAYEESLAILRKLAATDPGNTEWQRGVVMSLDNIGDVRLASNNPRGAVAAYEESIKTMRKLAAADPRNVTWQRDLFVTLSRLGNVRRATHDEAAARSAFEECITLMRTVAAADPANALWQRDLAAALEAAGDERLNAGEGAAAMAAYDESLAIRRKLAAADPGNAEWQGEFILSLARMAAPGSDPARARVSLNEAIAILNGLARDGKLRPAQQGWSNFLSGLLAKLPPESADAK